MTDIHTLLATAADRAHLPPLDLVMLTRKAARRRTGRRLRVGGALLAVAATTGLAITAIPPAGSRDRVVASTVEAASARPSTAPSPTLAVEATPRLLRVIQFSGDPFGTPTTTFSPGSATAGKDIPAEYAEKAEVSSIAVAFQALPVRRAGCVLQAVLVLPPATEASGTGELTAYPSAALSLAAGRVPPNGNRPTTLLDNRPSAPEQVLADGTRTFDVTELVSLWTDSEPFPSRGRTVPPATPIVIVVRPPTQEAGTYSRTFDVATSPPVLQARLASGCPNA